MFFNAPSWLCALTINLEAFMLYTIQYEKSKDTPAQRHGLKEMPMAKAHCLRSQWWESWLLIVSFHQKIWSWWCLKGHMTSHLILSRSCNWSSLTQAVLSPPHSASTPLTHFGLTLSFSVSAGGTWTTEGVTLLSYSDAEMDIKLSCCTNGRDPFTGLTVCGLQDLAAPVGWWDLFRLENREILLDTFFGLTFHFRMWNPFSFVHAV